ncbi:hypothetical protein [Leucobacter tenebrionis]|uniref:hypothetical protein n=1 Tax=Leucobacter tenebrionis TaxID=2873270 RepID=UPI001CA60869|nr:hypothetical protein [Leucobacter tenebrionis]QZY50897.1 hypothetical protein KVY00_09660 [Leucobacter tenebrionis]
MVAKPRSGIAAVILRASLALGIPLVLMGCAAPAEGPTEDPAPTGSSETTEPSESTPPKTTAPQPDPTESPVAIPSCEELVPLETVREQFPGAPDIETFHDSQEIQDKARELALGPAAIAALDGAEQMRHCAWGIPASDGISRLYVAELNADARDALIAELDGSVFVRSEEEGWIRYSDFSEGGVAPMHRSYFFKDRIWIVEISSAPEPTLAREALRHF